MIGIILLPTLHAEKFLAWPGRTYAPLVRFGTHKIESFVTLTAYFIFRFTDCGVFFENLKSGTTGQGFSEKRRKFGTADYEISTEKRISLQGHSCQYGWYIRGHAPALSTVTKWTSEFKWG